MDNFKEFQGSDLDSAIREACSYFDSPREKLEIEIIQDAKSGIFGIVGARKAKIRARRVRLDDAMQSLFAQPESAGEAQGSGGTGANRQPASATSEKSPVQKNSGQPQGHEKRQRQRQGEEHAPKCSGSAEQTVPETHAVAPTLEPLADEELESEDEALTPLEDLDAAQVERKTVEIVSNLLRPIAGKDVDVTVELRNGRARARVEWEGDAGLLIGREGQTLIAIQYMASRMLSHVMNAILHVQLDIGDYRRKQDDKLRELALTLAQKAREHGRPYSTRPLSSYHRRIIHLCLQDQADVQTRSSGDGQLKRVVIAPRRNDHGKCQP